jgi:hypothetical protein
MRQPPLTRRYAEGLERFLRDRSERALRVAYELGREAVQTDVSMLDLAACHNAALARMLEKESPDGAAAVAEAAGDFLIESLAAFEMVQRGLTEARRAAFRERRVARMLRQLTAVLGGAEVAPGDRESCAEIVQLVAEHARELTRSDRATVTVSPAATGPEITAVAEGEAVDTWSDVLGPTAEEIANTSAAPRETESLRAEIATARSGRIGFIELNAERGTFSGEDHDVVAQIAQLAGAALERAEATA